MLQLDGESLTLEQLEQIADARPTVGLVARRAARRRRSRARSSIARPTATLPVYGVNTGFGALAETAIPRDRSARCS